MNPTGAAPAWASIIPIIVVVAIVLLRNARARNLRVERLWIGPVLIVALTALSFWGQGQGQFEIPSPAMIGLDVIALIVGGFLGWHRGRFTRITVDPQTHVLTSKASAVGILVILAIMVARFGLRSFAVQNASALGVSLTDITDAFLLMAVGVVCMQRLEIYLRATRLLAEAKSGSAGQA
jgi:hypothetical protein